MATLGKWTCGLFNFVLAHRRAEHAQASEHNIKIAAAAGRAAFNLGAALVQRGLVIEDAPRLARALRLFRRCIELAKSVPLLCFGCL